MFDFNKTYDFDKKLAEDGQKMFVGDDQEEYVLVRRIPNKEYAKRLQQVMLDSGDDLKALREENEDAADKLDNKLQNEVLGETVVVGFGKKMSDCGTTLSYSKDTATMLLSKYEDFKLEVLIFANDRSNYRPKVEVEKVKKK